MIVRKIINKNAVTEKNWPVCHLTEKKQRIERSTLRSARMYNNAKTHLSSRPAIAVVLFAAADGRAVIWRDLNDETKYKRAKTTPTCTSLRREGTTVDTLVFPAILFPLLSFSRRRDVFLELQLEEKKIRVDPTEMSEERDCLSAYVGDVFRKPRRASPRSRAVS